MYAGMKRLVRRREKFLLARDKLQDHLIGPTLDSWGLIDHRAREGLWFNTYGADRTRLEGEAHLLRREFHPVSNVDIYL